VLIESLARKPLYRHIRFSLKINSFRLVTFAMLLAKSEKLGD
jgi:hypothetical protein